MKIVAAHQVNGQITASVEFDDLLTQTVTLPSWASKDNILAEATRLRENAEATARSQVHRADLVD